MKKLVQKARKYSIKEFESTGKIDKYHKNKSAISPSKSESQQ